MYVIIHLRPTIRVYSKMYVYYYLLIVKFNYISMDLKYYDYLTVMYGNMDNMVQ